MALGGWMDGYMDGWMDGWWGWVKDCLQQSKKNIQKLKKINFTGSRWQ